MSLPLLSSSFSPSSPSSLSSSLPLPLSLPLLTLLLSLSSSLLSLSNFTSRNCAIKGGLPDGIFGCLGGVTDEDFWVPDAPFNTLCILCSEDAAFNFFSAWSLGAIFCATSALDCLGLAFAEVVLPFLLGFNISSLSRAWMSFPALTCGSGFVGTIPSVLFKIDCGTCKRGGGPDLTFCCFGGVGIPLLGSVTDVELGDLWFSSTTLGTDLASLLFNGKLLCWVGMLLTSLCRGRSNCLWLHELLLSLLEFDCIKFSDLASEFSEKLLLVFVRSTFVSFVLSLWSNVVSPGRTSLSLLFPSSLQLLDFLFKRGIISRSRLSPKSRRPLPSWLPWLLQWDNPLFDVLVVGLAWCTKPCMDCGLDGGG